MNVAHGIRGIGCCLLALACFAAAAQAADAGEPAPTRFELDAVPQWDAARRDDKPAAPGLAIHTASAADSLRARWWFGRGAVEVGAGADRQALSSNSSAAQPWSQVVAVRATLSARARVVYETGATLPWRNTRSSAGARSARVALEFKSKKSAVSNLRDGLLRMQLSADSAVHLKPRGGGLQVTYRERF